MIQEPNSPELESDEKVNRQIKREMGKPCKDGQTTDGVKRTISQVPVEENVFSRLKVPAPYSHRNKNVVNYGYLGRLMRNADAEAIAQVLKPV